MKGLTFVELQQDPNTAGRVNIRSGTVKQAIGPNHWLLEFKGSRFRFSNVYSADDLSRFQFFNTEAEANLFIGELVSKMAPPEATPVAPLAPAGVPETPSAESSPPST